MSVLLILCWLADARAGVPVVLPDTSTTIEFDDSAKSAVEDAMAALSARRFDEAARAFGALADASGSADYRYLEAVSRYEAGDLRMAERAARAGVDKAPDHGALLSLYGLVLADEGKGDDALAVLDRAEQRTNGDEALHARILLNRGLVKLDRGEATAAADQFQKAKDVATAAGATDLAALADEDLGLVAALEGKSEAKDPVGEVADRLRKGDVAGAKKAIPKADPSDRRGTVRALLAQGDVARAEGRLDDAASSFEGALALAKEGGLVREQAAALAQVGIVNGLGGRYEIALDRLQEAVGLVAGTSFKVNELAYRVEAGRIAVRLEDLDGARAQLAAAKKASASVEDALGKARLSELEALIDARADDVSGARTAYGTAISAFEGRQDWAEAARISTELVELEAAHDDAGSLKAAETRAAGLFAKAGDNLGPAHVLVSEGLGKARKKDLDGALAAFTGAASAADALKTSAGARVAKIARDDAASTLLMAGHSQQAVDEAKKLGLEAAVADHQKFEQAEADYDAATKAFAAGKYTDARVAYDKAYKALAEIGEQSYALKARRGRAWATYDENAEADSAVQYDVYRRLTEEAQVVQDPELKARSMAAVALAAGALDKPEAAASLRSAAEATERMGLTSVAGQCWAELAEHDTTLDGKVAAARRAWDLRNGDEVGTYAMYSVAVDAYNAGDYPTSKAIAEEILPTSGKLKPSVQKVLEASQ